MTSNTKVKAGDTFESDYPFKSYVNHSIFGSQYEPEITEGWAMGCHKQTEDDGSEYGCDTLYTANGVGKIIFEVLAVAEMPRKYQSRVIYKFDRIEPEGERVNSSKCHTVTMSHFLNMIEAPYPNEYEVEEDFTPKGSAHAF